MKKYPKNHPYSRALDEVLSHYFVVKTDVPAAHGEEYEEMNDYEKELRDCSEKMIEISEECKVFFKKQFETSEKNDEEEKNGEGT